MDVWTSLLGGFCSFITHNNHSSGIISKRWSKIKHGLASRLLICRRELTEAGGGGCLEECCVLVCTHDSEEQQQRTVWPPVPNGHRLSQCMKGG